MAAPRFEMIDSGESDPEAALAAVFPLALHRTMRVGGTAALGRRAVHRAGADVRRSTRLIDVRAALAAELALLTQALSDPVADIAATLGLLEIHAQSAVGSFLGMTVTVDVDEHGDEYTFTALVDRTHVVRTSLAMPLPGGRVILYAAQPGALVDLAADLAWLTGSRLSDYALDEHLTAPAASPKAASVTSASTINQALGVLMGRGYTPEQARNNLDEQARASGTEPLDAARAIIASLATS